MFETPAQARAIATRNGHATGFVYEPVAKAAYGKGVALYCDQKEATMSQRVETPVDNPMPGAERMHETETIQQRMIREEAEARTRAYSPAMTDAEIEALIARLDRNSAARACEQTRSTNSVKGIRKMRAARTRELMRRSGNADRR